jgi:hypothetical protein
MMAKGRLEGGEMEEFEKDAPSSSSQRSNIVADGLRMSVVVYDGVGEEEMRTARGWP